jgi:hypothetical protein
MQYNAYANVNVLRSHWGRGIGRQLAAAIDAWACRLTGLLLAHSARAAVCEGRGISRGGTGLAAVRFDRWLGGGSGAGGEVPLRHGKGFLIPV